MTQPVADNTPVLVGWASTNQRVEDPHVAAEPLELMIRATRAALSRSGVGALGATIDRIYTARWQVRCNPARSRWITKASRRWQASPPSTTVGSHPVRIKAGQFFDLA